jgi:serine/threonine-protein kinase
VTVPDVVCEDVDAAQAEINAAGLNFALVGSEPSDDCPEGTVARQDPGAGAEVEPGTTVEVVEAEATEPSPTPTITLPTP